jgi:hypothetical protein
MEEENNVAVDTETTETPAVENTEKTYSQADIDDMKAKWESGFQKRLGKEIDKKLRTYEAENFKKDQLINVLKEQTQRETIDDLLDMSEEQYGVTIPRTRTNHNDEKVLGKHDAEEILELQDDEFAKSELDRLANLKRTEREEETYSELKSSIESRRLAAEREKEIKQNGLDEEVVNSDDFKTFEKKFSNNTSITDIYDMFEKINGIKEEKPFSAGSLKDTKSKQTDEFYTIDEFNALTAKDLDDPKVYEKAMKSMNHFYQQ